MKTSSFLQELNSSSMCRLSAGEDVIAVWRSLLGLMEVSLSEKNKNLNSQYSIDTYGVCIPNVYLGGASTKNYKRDVCGVSSKYFGKEKILADQLF